MPTTETPPDPRILAAAVGQLVALEQRHDEGSAERHAAQVAALDAIRVELTAIRGDLRELRTAVRSATPAAPARPPSLPEVAVKALTGRAGQQALLWILCALALPVSAALTIAAWRHPEAVLCLLDGDLADCPGKFDDP